MKRKFLTLAVGIIGLLELKGQATTWYYGNGGGVKITSTSTITPSSGSTINTNEGCAGVIDASNNCIFYTDGETIWNGNHVVQNTFTGTSSWSTIKLNGLSSSTHAALILPIPETNNTKFFLFTTTSGEARNNNDAIGHGPLMVSLLQVSGTAPNSTVIVTTANQAITPSNVLVGEKIAYTSDGGCGYWVMTDGVGTYGGGIDSPFQVIGGSHPLNTNGEGKFYAYHVTAATTTVSALQTTQVISTFTQGGHQSWGYRYPDPDSETIPTPYTGDVNALTHLTVSRGQMKFNQQGTKLGCALSNQREVQLYDFDRNTGLLSAQIRVQYGAVTSHGQCYEGLPYGFEFSPAGSFFYISTLDVPTNNGVFQYSVANSLSAINSSRKIVDYFSSQPSPVGGMQLGPDGRIYVAWTLSGSNGAVYIGTPDVAIPLPNNIYNFPSFNYSASGGVNGGITGAGLCKLTLPTVIQVQADPVSTPTIGRLPANFCSATGITATGGYTGATPSQYQWSLVECDALGNVILGESWTDVISNGTPGVYTYPAGVVSCNKYYLVKLGVKPACGTWKYITKKIFLACSPTPSISGTLDICSGESTTLCCNYMPSSNMTLAWDPVHSSTQCITVSPTTNTSYNVTATNQYGCSATSTATVNVSSVDPTFHINSQNTVNSGYFEISLIANTTTGLPAGFSSGWVVEELNSSSAVVWTASSAGCWNSFPAAEYFSGLDATIPGYSGTISCGTPSIGRFKYNTQYRFTFVVQSTVCDPVSNSQILIYTRGTSGGSFALMNDPNAPDVNYYLNIISGRDAAITETGTGFQVYPNPGSGIYTILNYEAIGKIQVFDMMGKNIKTITSNENQYTLDITGYPKGIYTVNVLSGNKMQSKKIVLE